MIIKTTILPQDVIAITLFPFIFTKRTDAGHCCWNTPYSKSFKFSNGMNLYEFFVSKVAKPIEAPVRFEVAMSGKKITEDIEIITDGLKFTYKIIS